MLFFLCRIKIDKAKTEKKTLLLEYFSNV